MSLNAHASALAPIGAESELQPANTFPLSKDLFLEARALFKKAANAKRLTSASICAWHILSGKDPQTGFTPVSNPIKLANGAAPMAAYDSAFRSASSLSLAALAPWSELLEAAGCVSLGWKWSGSHPILAALIGAKR